MNVPSANADTYGTGGPDAGYVPDNAGHNYCWSTGFVGTDVNAAARRAFATGAVNNLDSQTDMYNAGQQGCTTSTDVYWATFTAALDGQYQCQLFNSAGFCDRSLVQINPSQMSPFDADWTQTTCHELGHSAGLAHATDDCMGTSTALTTYSTHHVGHINAQF